MAFHLSSMEKRKRLLFSQEGSITVVIAFLLPIMLLMVALIININQLVFTKIKLQNTVDACALSAAAVQAAGLNEIADLNREMFREHNAVSQILRSGTWFSYSEANSARGFFYNHSNGVIDYIRRYQERANNSFAIQALNVAMHVKDLNLPQSYLFTRNNTTRLTTLIEKSRTIWFRYFTQSYSGGYQRPTLRWFNPGVKYFADNRNGRYIYFARRSVARNRSVTIPARVEKRSPTYVHYELYLPADHFILAGGIFGNFPALRADAAAKPAGGHVYRGVPEYRAVLVK